jgi:N6-adenosine-specific RNA methylase IME4
LVIIGKRGNPPPPREGTKPRSVIHAKAKAHSEKPVELYEAIEKAYPSCTRAELFARERRDGWTSFGLEIDGRDISIAIADVMKRAGISKAKAADALATPAAP